MKLEALIYDHDVDRFYMETSEGDRRSTLFLRPHMIEMDTVIRNFERGLNVLVLEMKDRRQRRVSLKERPDLEQLETHVEIAHSPECFEPPLAQSDVPLSSLIDFINESSVSNALDDICPYFFEELDTFDVPLKRRFNPGLKRTASAIFSSLSMYFKDKSSIKCTCVTMHKYGVSETNIYKQDRNDWIASIIETLEKKKIDVIEFWYSDYSVETVFVEAESDNPEELKLFVHGIDSHYSIKVLQSWDVKMLKFLLSALENRNPKDHLRVKFGGELLEDGELLSNYDLTDFDTLKVYVARPKFVGRSEKLEQIIIKTLDGSSYTLDVDADATIEDVKRMIQAQEGISIIDQKLKFAGKQLEDDRTLSDYDVANLNTLHLTLGLDGGAQKRKEIGDNEDDPSFAFAPVPQGDDVPQVLAGINLAKIDIAGWIKSLPLKTAEELVETLNTQSRTGNLTGLCSAYMFAVKEYSALLV